MQNKLYGYLGFAKKSGNLISGFETCIFAMKKHKVKLLIISADAAGNTVSKMEKEAKRYRIVYRKYGSSSDLSRVTGTAGRTVFAIIDQNFADVILKEIDQSADSTGEEKEGF
jgi:ribosomal protein L7Ae-like RNA K-turn-binding protein